MNVYKGRLLKKSSNRRSKLVVSTLVTTRLSIIAFHLLPPSEVAALFDSNLSRRPFLGQVVDSGLLLCTKVDLEQAVLFLGHIFVQRPMNDSDRKIERSDGRCLGRQQLFPIRNFISQEKKSDSLQPEIYKALKPC